MQALREAMRLGVVCGLLAAVTTGPAAAQVAAAPSSGPLAGVPLGMSVDGATTVGMQTLDPAAVLFKPVGFTTAVPTEGGGGAKPDFRTAALLRNPVWGIPAAMPLPDVDGMSLGLDWVLADPSTGEVTPPLGWGAVTFSVSRTTVGKSTGPNTIVNAEAQNGGDGASGDLFCWIVPKSTLLPPALNDVVLRAVDSTEANLYGGSPAQRGGIDAHDIFLSLYEQTDLVGSVLPAQPTFYFTVSSGTIGRVPSTWWGGTTPSGATILSTTWSSTTKSWSAPVPYRTFTQLGLLATEDVDAIAVDVGHGLLLFSTDSSSRDEMLVLGLGGPPTPKTYVMPGGMQTVSDKVGLRPTDHVKAICSLDPGGNQQLHQVACGTPLQPLFPLPVPYQAVTTAFRSFPGTQPLVQVHVSGFPPSGPQPNGFVALFVSADVTPSNLILVASRVRQPTPWDGQPQTFQLRLPRTPTLLGRQVLFHGAVVDPAVLTLDLAFPYRFHL